jgi:prepilin-type N-terminal cleavage/methylation domain-containing protein
MRKKRMWFCFGYLELLKNKPPLVIAIDWREDLLYMFTAPPKGFTLLEVCVVIGVAGVLVLIAKPPVKSFLENNNLKIAANMVKNQLVLAKTRALANPDIHAGVYFDTGGCPDTILAFLDDDNSSSTSRNNNQYTKDKDHILMGAISLPKKDTLKNISGNNGNNDVVVFRGDGSAKKSVSLIVSDNNNRSYTISVLASTGRIKVTKN